VGGDDDRIAVGEHLCLTCLPRPPGGNLLRDDHSVGLARLRHITRGRYSAGSGSSFPVRGPMSPRRDDRQEGTIDRGGPT
jgi:hypothetical protein